MHRGLEAVEVQAVEPEVVGVHAELRTEVHAADGERVVVREVLEEVMSFAPEQMPSFLEMLWS